MRADDGPVDVSLCREQPVAQAIGYVRAGFENHREKYDRRFARGEVAMAADRFRHQVADRRVAEVLQDFVERLAFIRRDGFSGRIVRVAQLEAPHAQEGSWPSFVRRIS